MKHLSNITKILVILVFSLFFTVLGFFILPIAVLFRVPTTNINSTSNQEKFRCPIVDYIYGNKFDGFGDIYYKRDHPIDTYLSRLNWCLLRNPTHNLGLLLGVNDKTIVKSIITGNPYVTDDPFPINTGLKFQEVYTIDNKYYPMYYYCLLWRQVIPFYHGDRGFRLLMGYKNFCVKELNQNYIYGFVCTVTHFKKFVVG